MQKLIDDLVFKLSEAAGILMQLSKECKNEYLKESDVGKLLTMHEWINRLYFEFLHDLRDAKILTDYLPDTMYFYQMSAKKPTDGFLLDFGILQQFSTTLGHLLSRVGELYRTSNYRKSKPWLAIYKFKKGQDPVCVKVLNILEEDMPTVQDLGE